MIDETILKDYIQGLIKTEKGYDTGEAESAYRDCAKDILSFIDHRKEIV